MRKRALFVLLLILLIGCNQATNRPTPSSSPTEPLSGERTFKFSTSGAHHPEGFGAWYLQLDAAGVLSITHDLRGELTPYGPFVLSEQETSDFWNLIDAARLERQEPSSRAGVPDEISYTFVLNRRGREHALEIWAGDVQEDPELADLVAGIDALIEAHTQSSLLSLGYGARTWEVGPVLVEFGTFREDPAPFGVSRAPEFVLYADGRLVVHGSAGLQEAHLTRRETCALLNTIEQTGFFDVDVTAFQQEIDQLGWGLVSMTRIEVQAWQSRRVAVDALWEAIQHEEVEVPFALGNTFELLSSYRPDDLAPFQSGQLALAIYRYTADASPETKAIWSLDSPSLEELFARATVENRQAGRGLLLEGDVAARVAEEIRRADQRVFAEHGVVYSVSVRPLLPYESLESAVGYQARIPSPDVAITLTLMTCYASDGVLDVAPRP